MHGLAYLPYLGHLRFHFLAPLGEVGNDCGVFALHSLRHGYGIGKELRAFYDFGRSARDYDWLHGHNLCAGAFFVVP